MELARAVDHSSRGLTMHVNKVHPVRTLALVARDLDKDEDWLADPRARHGAGGRADLGLRSAARGRDHGLHRIRRRKPAQPHRNPSQQAKIGLPRPTPDDYAIPQPRPRLAGCCDARLIPKTARQSSPPSSPCPMPAGSSPIRLPDGRDRCWGSPSPRCCWRPGQHSP